jgi:hypothetical protein
VLFPNESGTFSLELTVQSNDPGIEGIEGMEGIEGIEGSIVEETVQRID